jgi:methylated-DNA-protein-cysteine methyltransferase related protein
MPAPQHRAHGKRTDPAPARSKPKTSKLARSGSKTAAAKRTRSKTMLSKTVLSKTVLSKTPRRTTPRSPTRQQDNASDASLEARVLAAVRRIPRGRVSTYGDIASVAGLPRRARLVGTVLRHSPAQPGLPWFRVINAGGRSSLPEGSDAQRRQLRLLQAEGIEVRRGRVDLRRYGWPSREGGLDELLWKLS